MRLRSWIIPLVAAAAAISASNTFGSGAARVTSSLDGKTVLPQRSRWLVHPGIPVSSVREVDYLIDGKLSWVERSSPYYFGGDDNGADPGYLITTWIGAGRHVFTSRVVGIDGKATTDVVTARVRAAAPPPTTLA